MKDRDASRYLVIDQGGHSTRAIIFTAQGEVLHTVQASVHIRQPQPGGYEQDPTELAGSLKQCLQNLSTAFTDKNLRPVSAALVTQRSSLIACDRHTGKALTPIISWQDTRHDAWLQQQIHEKHLDVDALRTLTGLRLNAHYGASKMRWLLDHNSVVQQAAAEKRLLFLPLAAYVAHLLTQQEQVVDAVSASRTFLTRLGACEWSPELLELFKIPRHCLPPIVPTRYPFGVIEIAGHNIPLQVVGGDQSFIPFAYGSPPRDDALFVNLGTGAFVQTTLAPEETPARLLNSAAAIEPARTFLFAEGTVNACASALDWLFATAGQPLSSAAREEAFQQHNDVPVFFHRLTALGSPYWLPVGDSHFSRHAELPEQAVAVMESVAFLLAINIDLLQQAKPGLKEIRVSGGLAHSNGFCQRLANVTGLAVLRHGDVEASARGALFYLAQQKTYSPPNVPQFFKPTRDAALLARYQVFYEWLRTEWLRMLQESV